MSSDTDCVDYSSASYGERVSARKVGIANGHFYKVGSSVKKGVFQFSWHVE
jgi:hypothetical protein